MTADVLAYLLIEQVLENADTHFRVGSGHWVTVTGRTDKNDYDLSVASKSILLISKSYWPFVDNDCTLLS